jgi:hypothetical protein
MPCASVRVRRTDSRAAEMMIVTLKIRADGAIACPCGAPGLHVQEGQLPGSVSSSAIGILGSSLIRKRPRPGILSWCAAARATSQHARASFRTGPALYSVPAELRAGAFFHLTQDHIERVRP